MHALRAPALLSIYALVASASGTPVFAADPPPPGVYPPPGAQPTAPPPAYGAPPPAYGAPPAYGQAAPVYAQPAAATSTGGSGSGSAPVTQEQFKQVLKIFKRVVDRFDTLEKKVNKIGGKADQKSEDAVDLDELDAKSPGAAPIATGGGGGGTHSASAHGGPGFKVYFDLNLVNRPGVTDLSFVNYHALLLFEMVPNSDLQFSFDINPTPRYYELDWQVSKKLQLRFGKIWIPFDDMAPHNVFGGRVNVSRLAPDSAFLPDLWTELGVGAKYNLFDKPKLTMDIHAYVVNGFGSGGSDPYPSASGPVSSDYPKFGTETPTSDNNRNKAIGGRITAKFLGMFGFGASFYTGRWSDETAAPQNLNVMGFDGQVRYKNTEFRTGIAAMSIGLSTSPFKRDGLYGEVGQKFGKENNWKILARGGTIQLDSRVRAITDQQLVGATLLWRPNLIEYSLEHSRDLKQVDGKTSYSYTAARVVIAL